MHDSPKRSRIKRPKRRDRLIETFGVDEPRYFLGQVAFAAGISSNLLKAWISRKVVPMGNHDRDAHGKGSSRIFTLRRALAIGLTAELVQLGLSASAAGFLSPSGMDAALEESAGDPLGINSLIAIYPHDGGTAEIIPWNCSLKKLLGRDASAKDSKDILSSILVVSTQRIAARVLLRLGELER